MTQRTYPYTGWVLLPSFKPTEVLFIKPYWPSEPSRGDESGSGKHYPLSWIHPTREAAIAFGWKEVERMQADIDKRTENLRKKRAALLKAENTPIQGTNPE